MPDYKNQNTLPKINDQEANSVKQINGEVFRDILSSNGHTGDYLIALM